MSKPLVVLLTDLYIQHAKTAGRFTAYIHRDLIVLGPMAEENRGLLERQL
jgi:hypothetical protein